LNSQQAAGTRGQRFSMKNTRIMMTQPMGGSQGDIYAIAATVRELNAIYQVWRIPGCCVLCAVVCWCVLVCVCVYVC
jgi:hypothetical protein